MKWKLLMSVLIIAVRGDKSGKHNNSFRQNEDLVDLAYLVEEELDHRDHHHHHHQPPEPTEVPISQLATPRGSSGDLNVVPTVVAAVPGLNVSTPQIPAALANFLEAANSSNPVSSGFPSNSHDSFTIAGLSNAYGYTGAGIPAPNLPASGVVNNGLLGLRPKRNRVRQAPPYTLNKQPYDLALATRHNQLDPGPDLQFDVPHSHVPTHYDQNVYHHFGDVPPVHPYTEHQYHQNQGLLTHPFGHSATPSPIAYEPEPHHHLDPHHNHHHHAEHHPDYPEYEEHQTGLEDLHSDYLYDELPPTGDQLQVANVANDVVALNAAAIADPYATYTPVGWFADPVSVVKYSLPYRDGYRGWLVGVFVLFCKSVRSSRIKPPHAFGSLARLLHKSL